MNDARIKTLRQQRYREVDDEQGERNRERIDHVSSILSGLEERTENPTTRLETAKELLSLAGAKIGTRGCNTILTDCLKLIRESAEDAGLGEYYREQMPKMPSKTVSKTHDWSGDHPDSEFIEEKRRRMEQSASEEGGCDRQQV